MNCQIGCWNLIKEFSYLLVDKGKNLGEIEVRCFDEIESYRELFGVSNDDVLVLWFHHCSISFSYSGFDVAEFEPKKLEVHSMKRVGETEDNEVYEIFSSAQYDGRNPDDESLDGSPQSGYIGPFVVWPKND